MKLQVRDIEIINYLEEFKGATIEQIAKLYFKGSYEASKKRLKVLETSKEIKGCMHHMINKKVYYLIKIPSYHRIITNEIRIILLQNVEVISFKYEAKINKYKIDALCVYKKTELAILLIEVDIYNRTKSEKIQIAGKDIKMKTGIEPTILIICLYGRRERENKKIIEVKIKEINTLVKYI